MDSTVDEVELDITAVGLAADLIELASDPTGRISELAELVRRCQEGRINETFGEPKWASWLFGRLNDVIPRDLDPVDRVGVGEILIRSGLSIRNVARIVGVSHAQVQREKHPDLRPENDRVIGADGRSYPARKPRSVTAVRSRPRAPIQDSFYRSVNEALRSIRSIERLTRDDRFPSVQRTVQSTYAGAFQEIQELLRAASARLGNTETNSHTEREN